MPAKLKTNSRIAAAVERGRKEGARAAAVKSKKSASAARMPALDSPATAYAKLLLDPCYARLAHPIYNTADGGCLSRFEAEFTIATLAAETATIVAFVPGGLARSVFSNATSLTGDATPTLLNNQTNASTAPGFAFLQATASAVRPVAACMQIVWPGTELNRQGYVALGQATGSLVTQALSTTTTVTALRPLAHLRARMPDKMVEVRWRPQGGDADWTDPSTATADGDLQKKGAIFAAVSNLPVSGGTSNTGVRIRIIAVYEWQPKSAQGMASNADDRARSRNTVTDVINALDKNGPDWAYNLGRGVNIAGNIAQGYYARRGEMVAG